MLISFVSDEPGRIWKKKIGHVMQERFMLQNEQWQLFSGFEFSFFLFLSVAEVP
jgi:hypothetical protein